MMRGLPASIIFHAMIVSVGYFSWPFMVASTRDYASESVAIPIDIVDIGALNNIAPVLRPPPEPEVKDEVVPEEVPEDPPEEETPEEVDPVDETLPEDEIDTARAEDTPEEAEPEDVTPDFDAEPEAAEKEPEPKPEEPKPAVKKPDLLDDFLNTADSTFESERETRKRQDEPTPRSQPLLKDTPPQTQQVRSGAGARTANTARLESLLYSQVKSCWAGVDDLAGAKDLNVVMTILIDENGYLREDVKLISPTRVPLGRSPERTAVQRALTAVRKCEPYRLPKQDYADWDDYNTIRLGPKFEPN